MRKILKKTVLVSLAVLTLVFTWWILAYHTALQNNSYRSARQGLLDLRNWDFEEQGLHPLKGEWLFIPSVFAVPDVFSRFNESFLLRSETLTVPGFWNLQNSRFPAESYGTLVLRVQLPEDMEDFGLYLEEISSAYTLYIDGQQVIRNGIVGTSARTSRANSIPRIWSGSRDTEEITLLLHISNYQASRGGLSRAPLIGPPSRIFQRHSGEVALDLFLFGSILMMALYHFGISLFRSADRSSFYFALFCTAIALRGILTGSRFLQGTLPCLGFQTSTSMELICAYTAAYFYYQYHSLRFPAESWRPFLYFSRVLLSFMTISAIVMPIRQHADLFFLFEVYLIGEIIIIMGGLVLAVFRRRNEAPVYITGFTILCMAVLHDLLFYNRVAGDGYLLHYGLWIFVLLHSILLARQFVSLEKKARSYADSLEKLTSDLEQRIGQNLD